MESTESRHYFIGSPLMTRFLKGTMWLLCLVPCRTFTAPTKLTPQQLIKVTHPYLHCSNTLHIWMAARLKQGLEKHSSSSTALD